MPNVRRRRPDGHRGEVQLALFPEHPELNNHAACWTGKLRDKWKYPRIEVRLISMWTHKHGWQIGWFARVDQALDEWHPQSPTAYLRTANYPWYRPDSMPSSNRFEMAAGSAARAVKIVLAQMKEYTTDGDNAADLVTVSENIEAQAQAWLTT